MSRMNFHCPKDVLVIEVRLKDFAANTYNEVEYNNGEDTLRGLDTLGRFSAIFEKGDKFGDFMFAFLRNSPLRKRGLL